MQNLMSYNGHHWNLEQHKHTLWNRNEIHILYSSYRWKWRVIIAVNFFCCWKFTVITSFHCTGRYELNKLTSLPMCGFTAQLVEHRTSFAEVMGSNPVEASFSGFFLPIALKKKKIYCDDHSSLSWTHISKKKMWIFFAFKKKFTVMITLHFMNTH